MIRKNSSILNWIRTTRHPGSYVPPPEEPDYNEHNVPVVPLSADEWQEFKRKFVEEYGGEKVQPTGMTHTDFLNYIKTSGEREGDEFEPVSLYNPSSKESIKKKLEELGWNDEEDDPDFDRLFE